MNFDCIENLSYNELKELYDTVIESNDLINYWVNGYCPNGDYCFDACIDARPVYAACHYNFVNFENTTGCKIYEWNQGGGYQFPTGASYTYFYRGC